jgi:DUF4097 and DUF4098 domain-containing protein YvlB
VKDMDLGKWNINFTDDDFTIDSENLVEYTEERTFPFSESDTLHVFAPAGSLTIRPSEDGQLKIRIEGKVDGTQNLTMEDFVQRSGNTLKMNLATEKKGKLGVFKLMHNFASLMTDAKIDLEVPKNFAELEIEGASLDIDLTDVQLNEARIKLASGDANIRQAQAEFIEITSVSGETDIKDIKSERMTITAVSGDIRMENIEAQAVETSIVSGDVEVRDLSADKLFFSSVSGDVKFASSLVDKYIIEFESLSGKLTGEEPFSGDSHRRIKFKSVSGSAIFTKL